MPGVACRSIDYECFRGIRHAWHIEAVKAGTISSRFRFPDLKIKALPDFDGDSNDLAHFSCHKSKSMAERYNRTPDKVTALHRPTRCESAELPEPAVSWSKPWGRIAPASTSYSSSRARTSITRSPVRSPVVAMSCPWRDGLHCQTAHGAA